MLRKTVAAVLVAAFASSAGLEFAAQPASAMPTGSVPDTFKINSNVQPAAWVYVPGKHGKRWKNKRAGYGYYYGGWWYARPWWTIGPAPGPWVYGPKYGKRYKYRYGPYVYYYNGWYYPKPWWRPGISIGIGF
jgi:hypothetical protein